jgi:hypothetical protein
MFSPATDTLVGPGTMKDGVNGPAFGPCVFDAEAGRESTTEAARAKKAIRAVAGWLRNRMGPLVTLGW